MVKNFPSWNFAPYPTHNVEIDLEENNPLICKASPEENGTGQYPVWITQKPRKGDFRVLKSKKFPSGAYPRPPKKLAPLALVKEIGQ